MAGTRDDQSPQDEPPGKRPDDRSHRPDHEARLAALERALAAMRREVRTARLVVVDETGTERIVGEVVEDNAELRVQLPSPLMGSATAAVLYACPPGQGLDPGVGLQLWAEGNALAELDVWPDEEGQWQVIAHFADFDR